MHFHVWFLIEYVFGCEFDVVFIVVQTHIEKDDVGTSKD